MPQQARARDRKQRILDAAAAVFARRGYGDTAVDEIAREAGTSKGGLYFHFPGKHAIMLHLLDHTSRLLMRKVRAAIAAEADPVARAEAALRVLLDVTLEHQSLARIFAVEAMGAGPEFTQRVMRIHDRFADVVQEQLDDAVAQGVIAPIDTRVVAHAWVGLLNSVITRAILRPEEGGLEAAYPTLRVLLLQSVGAPTHSTTITVMAGAGRSAGEGSA